MRARIGTTSILCIMLMVFLLELANNAVGNDARLLELGALPDNGQIDHEYWRLIVAGFLHYNLTHLALNTLLLLLVGPFVESRARTGWLLVIFLTASMTSFLGIFVRHQFWPSRGVSLGASGGLFGLLGAGLVFAYRLRSQGRAVRARLLAILMVALIYSALPGISMTGHIVGLIVGTATALLTPWIQHRRQSPAPKITLFY
jgi:membrane associated rhomboid family serine protease